MSYPGNSALPPDVQERILQTYGQSLDLAAAGKLQEARLGCDFVLRLDGMFAPARTLQDRLASATGPIEVHDLRPEALAEQADFASIGGLEDLPDLEPLDLGGDGEGESLAVRISALARARDFRGVLELAGANQAEIVADPELRRLAMQAGERLEAEPLVLGIVGGAERALAEGRPDEAERQLAQARELDPDHPAVLALEGRLSDSSEDFDLENETLPQLSAPSLEPLFGSESTPALSLSLEPPAPTDSDPRIAELLGDGQAAFERGEYQAAIDAWSRIFLIDIDHAEANRRIEEARRRRAEGERELEARLHEAESLVASGDRDGARVVLGAILERQPGFYAAQELLDRLDAPEDEVVAPGAGARLASSATSEVLKEEILVPPEPGVVRERRAGAPTLPKPGKAGRSRSPLMLVAIGVLVLILAGAAGWYLLTRSDEVFPNIVETVTDELSPIERARSLYESGKPANAIGLLKRVPPGEAHYEEAQALLAEWEGPATPVEEPGVDPAEVARLEKLVADARAAFEARILLQAATLYDQAAETISLDPEDADRHRRALARREELADVRRWLQDSEYEVAMPDLWRRYEADRGDRDLFQLLVTGYYNLGLRDVQRGLYPKAIEALSEASTLAPEDEGVARLLAFARTYRERPEDLLSRIFLKYSVPRVP